MPTCAHALVTTSGDADLAAKHPIRSGAVHQDAAEGRQLMAVDSKPAFWLQFKPGVFLGALADEGDPDERY